ncbi:MAG TPA: caspase family protein, partial [Alphaproteobacteria bacterium]|nr:caspase family protein [Alphaproteobacteria bacterium]
MRFGRAWIRISHSIRAARWGALGVCAIVALFTSMVAGQARAADAETRVALVIGIGAYQNAPPLANPVNDARRIAEALRRLNFEVEEQFDPDIRKLTRSLREFGLRAQNADAALVFYAGHGVQVDRENYLLPVDARLERERDLLYEALSLELVLGEVSQAKKVGIVILDACRNNPFVDRLSRSVVIAGRAPASKGLARVDRVPRNTIVAMATKADQIAEDGVGGNSPFTEALLAHLQVPGLELSLFFRSVRDVVLKSTNNRQEPYIFSSLGADPFYFYPRPPNRAPEIAPIVALQVTDAAGPTPLGIQRPTDPDQDPLSIRVIGLPRGGEVRVGERLVALNDVLTVDRFMAATFKPDGTRFGQIGTFDFLVEDG